MPLRALKESFVENEIGIQANTAAQPGFGMPLILVIVSHTSSSTIMALTARNCRLHVRCSPGNYIKDLNAMPYSSRSHSKIKKDYHRTNLLLLQLASVLFNRFQLLLLFRHASSRTAIGRGRHVVSHG